MKIERESREMEGKNAFTGGNLSFEFFGPIEIRGLFSRDKGGLYG